MTTDEQALDGNAAGGVLGQIFAFEMTTAHVVCATCGNGWTMAQAAVYATAMGTIIRCPGCGNAVIRVAHGPHQHWLDFSGLRQLRVHESE